MSLQTVRFSETATTDQALRDFYIAEARRLRSEAIRHMISVVADRLRRALDRDTHRTGGHAHGAA